MKGILISLEGPDGCGKTTLAQGLYQSYLDLGVKVKLCSLFSNKEFNAHVKHHVVNGDGDNLANALLMISVIHQTYIDDIKGFLEAGYLVITDRWTSSTAIYHGNQEVVLNMLSAASIAKPDITLLLDTDPSTIALRLQERVSAGSDDKADRIRVEQVERLNAAYMTLLDNQHLHSSVLGFMHLIKPDVNVMMDYLNEIFGLAKPSDDFQVSENTVRGEVCAKLKSMIKSGATGFLSADIAPVEVNNLYEDPITEFLSSANIRTLAELKARLDSLSLPQLLKIAYIKYIHIEEVDTAGGLSKSTLHIGRWLYVQLCMYTSLPDHGVDVVMRRDLKSSICSTAAMFLSALRIPMDLPYSQAVFAPRFCDAQSTYVIFNNLRLSMVDFSVCTYLNEESNLVTLLVKTVGMA